MDLKNWIPTFMAVNCAVNRTGLLLAFWFLGQAPQARGQYFTDMFTGSALNTMNWRVVPAFSDSVATQTGGSLVLANGGKVVTANQLPTVVDATLKFQFSGNSHDNLRIVTRTDGTTNRGEFARGIVFQVQMQTDPGDRTNNISIHNASGAVALGTYPIALNQSYTARVVDDGTSLYFYINDTNSPLLRATDSTVYGRQIGLRNREGAAAGSFISAGSEVRISAFAVNSTSIIRETVTVQVPVQVPDTSGRLVNLSTLGSGNSTVGFVVRGDTLKTMLVRAVGPTLSLFGVSNPATQTSITLRSNVLLRTNSGWSHAQNAVQIGAFGGAFPLPVGSADSAVMMPLQPGAYTAQITANGDVLLEVYEVP